MQKSKPIFFDETGKRQKVVDFVILILILFIAYGSMYIAYYYLRSTNISGSAKVTQNKPMEGSTTVIYTESNGKSFDIIGDRIQHVSTILLPKYLVTESGITTPLTYEILTKSVKEQSHNINTHYDKYLLLGSQDFDRQPVERIPNDKVDAQIPEIIKAEQIEEIVAGAINSNVSGLYVYLNLRVMNDRQVKNNYRDWLSKLRGALSAKGLHLGIIIDPYYIQDKDLDLLETTDMIYIGQSKADLSSQIEGIERLKKLKPRRITYEIPTVSLKTDTREYSRSTINVEYGQLADLLTNKKIEQRSLNLIKFKKDYYEYTISDTPLAYNFMQALAQVSGIKNSYNYAISDPGFEEYTSWELLTLGPNNPRTRQLISNEMISKLEVPMHGDGQIYSIEKPREYGERQIEIDARGYITSTKITKKEVNAQVVRHGQKPKAISLTFDDGPNPIYTVKIMDILESYGVKGTFFVIGQNVIAHPEVAESIVARGHEIQNHTYTHPVFGLLTEEANKSQIIATNDIIYSVTGVRPQFFRKPYSDSSVITNTSDIRYLQILNELGLQASEYDIDSKDWSVDSSEKIVQNVKDQINSSDGRYSQILLHDIHQNPDLTVEALPEIIEFIQSQGIELVSVSQLAETTQKVSLSGPTNFYTALHFKKNVFNTFNAVCLIFIFLSFLRYGWMIVGSIFYKIKYTISDAVAKNINPSCIKLPKLTIIIACYNEEKVIGRTIEALQNNSYTNYRLIIINDGSTDRTAEVVSKYKKNDNRITLSTVPNGGKSEALRRGMAMTKGGWLVFCDADTVFAPDALYKFAVATMTDNRLDAVAAKISIGNDRNLLTSSQTIEYEIAYRFIKSSQDISNMITVVPGAAGLWRSGMLKKAGGFSSDTLSEDADATMRVISMGGRIGYRSNISAYTEVPEDISMLFRQRTRWQLGNMQSLLKHRKGLLSMRYGTLGMFGLPLFLNEIISTIVYPFILLITVSVFLTQGTNGINAFKSFTANPTDNYLIFFGLIVIAIEIILSLLVALTTNKPWTIKFKLLLSIPYYVTFYKILLSSFTIVATARALRGRMQGWDHLRRTNHVQLRI